MWPYRNGSRRGREKSDLSQFGNIVKWWHAVAIPESDYVDSDDAVSLRFSEPKCPCFAVRQRLHSSYHTSGLRLRVMSNKLQLSSAIQAV